MEPNPNPIENPVEISAETTPNPNSIKFAVNRRLLESGSCNYTNRDNTEGSPLASKLFEMHDISGVLIGPDFVTVSKAPACEWSALVPSIIRELQSFLSSGQTAVTDIQKASKDTTEIEKKIMEVLDSEIRPAVARDGGDIIFYGFEDGIVKLHLQGACSTCPSSIMTLKMGIENRLKSMFPEVQEVMQV